MSTGMTTRDLLEFVKGLRFTEDQRKPPDGRRRGQFHRGWTRATNGKRMLQRTLDARLTWNNLGYRAGMALGGASDLTIDDVFMALARLYQRADPKPTARLSGSLGAVETHIDAGCMPDGHDHMTCSARQYS